MYILTLLVSLFLPRRCICTMACMQRTVQAAQCTRAHWHSEGGGGPAVLSNFSTNYRIQNSVSTHCRTEDKIRICSNADNLKTHEFCFEKSLRLSLGSLSLHLAREHNYSCLAENEAWLDWLRKKTAVILNHYGPTVNVKVWKRAPQKNLATPLYLQQIPQQLIADGARNIKGRPFAITHVFILQSNGVFKRRPNRSRYTVHGGSLHT